MSGHVPPPGAAEAVELAALEFLVRVQTAIGTTHSVSVFTIALAAVVKTGARFGLAPIEIISAIRQAERMIDR